MPLTTLVNQSTVTREHRYATPSDMAAAVANEVHAALDGALASRDRASLVVSGGSEALLLFPYLRMLRLEWQRVTIALAHERWLPVSHPDSCEGLVRRELMLGPVADAELVGFHVPGVGAAEGARIAEQTYARVARPFDVVLLGVGDDGRTASLVPGTGRDVLERRSTALAVAGREPEGTTECVSLTPRALLDARHSFMVVAGRDQASVYRDALRDGPLDELPVRSILHGTTRYGVDVFSAA